jgi:hypothetical protein
MVAVAAAVVAALRLAPEAAQAVAVRAAASGERSSQTRRRPAA